MTQIRIIWAIMGKENMTFKKVSVDKIIFKFCSLNDKIKFQRSSYELHLSVTLFLTPNFKEIRKYSCHIYQFFDTISMKTFGDKSAESSISVAINYCRMLKQFLYIYQNLLYLTGWHAARQNMLSLLFNCIVIYDDIESNFPAKKQLYLLNMLADL
jgi:hypothetical protein